MSKTISYTFRIPEDLREKLERLAEEDGRTLSNLIILILRKAVERYEKDGKL